MSAHKIHTPQDRVARAATDHAARNRLTHAITTAADAISLAIQTGLHISQDYPVDPIWTGNCANIIAVLTEAHQRTLSVLQRVKQHPIVPSSVDPATPYMGPNNE
jgi:hypothetical protein